MEYRLRRCGSALWLAAFILLLACDQIASAQTDSALNVTVGAYFFPWHSDDFDNEYLRGALGQGPYLGEYNTSDGSIISRHLSWSRYAGISLWAMSWWGPNSREDKTIKGSILSHEQLGDHKLALFYESRGRLHLDGPMSMGNVVSDVEYMCDEYFRHSNYYHIDGRPVLFLYLTRALEEMELLEGFIVLIRSTSCGRELYLVGDHASGDVSNSPALAWLDAISTSDVYGAIQSYPYAGTDAIDTFFDAQRNWKEAAVNTGFIPCISPGYNTIGASTDSRQTPLSRRIAANATEGSFFQESLKRAIQLVDQSAGSLLMINSWNQWRDDTQIEPTASGSVTNAPDNITGGLSYEAYGQLYLEILRSVMGITQRLSNQSDSTIQWTTFKGTRLYNKGGDSR